MNTPGVVGYGLAALGFAFLTVLLLVSRRGRRTGVPVVAASAMTALWALVLMWQASRGSLPLLFVYVAEIARDAAWLLVLTRLAGAALPRWLALGTHALWIGLLILVPAAAAWPVLAARLAMSPLLLSRSGLALALCGLVLLEQVHRNADPAARKALRQLVVGLGMLFAYDLYLYSQAELLQAIDPDAWNARGYIAALAVPLLVLAVRRNPQWSFDVFVSRQMVFYTGTFIAVGVYLLLMAVAGYVIRNLGGSWGLLGQIVFFSGAAVVLVFLLASSALRRKATVFLSKHFYSNKYDYRIEWLRFIQTLSSTSEEDIRCTAIRAVAQIYQSPGGILLLADERNRQLVPVAAWPLPLASVPGHEPIAADSELVQFVRDRQWIIDLDEYRLLPDRYQNIGLPAWLVGNASLRIVSPLLQLDRLFGFFVLYDPPPPFELTYEDRDLLKTVGRHVATQLAQRDADDKLAESRQFEAYNRLTAFMMHDLKNSVAQLQLIVTNAQRHRHNPEFIDDVIETVANTVERMNRLMEQLRQGATEASNRAIRLDDLVRNTVDRCGMRTPVPEVQVGPEAIMVKADLQRLSAVLEHVIRNAQDATTEGTVVVSLVAADNEARLVVEDSGDGMTGEFVRERLFRPFDSTKGSKGMGIGAYQTREYVRLLGGQVEVQSRPGQGTRFSITLPLWNPMNVSAGNPE
jgi:putative PEP-CTERM system histidine kinase